MTGGNGNDFEAIPAYLCALKEGGSSSIFFKLRGTEALCATESAMKSILCCGSRAAK